MVAGVTSLGAPIIAGRNQRRGDVGRFAHERTMRDSAETHAILDEIAGLIPATIQEAAALRSKHNTSGSTDANDYLDELRSYSRARNDLVKLHARLILRTGRESLVARACGDAIEAIDAAGMDASTLITLDQPRPADWETRSMTERARMWQRYQEYPDAASTYVNKSD